MNILDAVLRAEGDWEGWLGRQDSNLRMAASKAAALPLGDAPAGAFVGSANGGT